MERNTRLCKCCNMNVKNVYHVVLVCPAYTQLRRTHFKMYFRYWPSVNKCVQLMISTTTSEWNKLENKYVHKALARKKANDNQFVIVK
jgi:hypothetical protein